MGTLLTRESVPFLSFRYAYELRHFMNLESR